MKGITNEIGQWVGLILFGVSLAFGVWQSGLIGYAMYNEARRYGN